MEALTAEVVRVRFRTPDGAFGVLSALTDGGEEVAITGPVAHLEPGEVVDLRGDWREHERHGRQFVACGLRVREPVSDEALLGVLAGVRHVGRSGAAWLLAEHGTDVLAVVDGDPRARLRAVPGIADARIDGAVASWREARGTRAARLALDALGLEAAVVGRIVRALGADAVRVVHDDPYALTAVDGVGFATADALARSLGVPPDAPARLRAGVLHALRAAEDDGHCLLPRAELDERCRRLLEADAGEAIATLAVGGEVVEHAGRVAERSLDRVERRLAARVDALLRAPPAFSASARRPVTGAFVPTDDQWAVVEGVLASRLSILTGGPGTGKTAALRALVEACGAARLRIALCAPTGKAARRLAEATGAEATTIHRLLGWAPGEGFERGADDPIEGAHVLVVDEASMLGVRLAGALFAAVGPATHVLLVGDPDQLAPVGPGRVLGDLLASGRVPVTRLTEIFRQAAGSLIVRAAHAINRGEPPPVTPPDGVRRDFFLIRREDPRAAFDEVVELASRRLREHLGADVQVLSPMHRGPLGIDALNDALRARLNPAGEPVRGTALRVGDRVVQTVNDHERLLMNGETGVLVALDGDGARVTLRCDDGRVLVLPGGALSSFRLAYAMSVHKAQGSSARGVVVPLSTAHAHMLTRSLVYTALTRAERTAVFVGQPAALALALRRVDAGRRHTRLAELLRAAVLE